MNDNAPEPGPIESTPLATPYKDRSVGLTIFGILTILLGCLAGLFIPLMLFGQVASAKAQIYRPIFRLFFPPYSFTAFWLWLWCGWELDL